MNDHDNIRKELLNQPIPNTNVTAAEVFMVGYYLLNHVGTCHQLGHATPAETLDYAPTVIDRNRSYPIVMDYTAWVGRREKLRPGSEDRLRDFIVESGWQRAQLLKVDRLLSQASAS